jgi:ELWxxDGT repeat protein
VNGTLFFAANDGTRGHELWKSDGTSTGTVLVKDIRPGAFGSYPYSLTNVGGRLFFIANDGTNGRELWISDGTSTGTVLVKDINQGAGHAFGTTNAPPPSFTNVNGTLYFGR